MKNIMEVKLRKNNNNISYTYTVTGPWREAFNLDGIDGWFALAGNGVHDFFIEYDMNVESVPNSIAIIPFICNVLPIAWLYDAEIHVDEIDEDFYNSVEGIKKGYIKMYPSVSFKGGLIANKIIKNRHPIIHSALYPFKRNRAIIFFSGGVDANFTLLSNLDEKPMLLTLWGSDLFFNNKDDWEEVSNKHYNTARKLGLPYTSLKSSFRFFINYNVLDKKIKSSGASGYWHGFQHGIGLISHAAPLAWIYRMKRVYISSSYSINDGVIKCASHPTIDEQMRFCGCEVIHFDFNVTRQKKVERIVEVQKERNIEIELRVCWQHAKGSNCCRCEKCVRTLLAILAEGGDPEKFGFKNDEETQKAIGRMLKEGKIQPNNYYREMVEKFRSDGKWEGEYHVQALLEVYQD